MNAKDIPAHEADFRARGVDSDGKKFSLKPFQATIPGTGESFEVVSCASGDESFFYREEHPKRRIVLHFTAGYLKGDIAALTKKDDHVSVPFVVARDGTIYNLWPSKYWSYHLGHGAQGGNEEMSRSSVAIEISNVGYLQPSGSNLATWFGSSHIYCGAAETELFTEIETPFRGYTRFASFTDAQYQSLGSLLRFLARTYGIPLQLLPEDQRYDVYGQVADFQGITSHVNYVPSGKWDLGPAFDWQRLASELTRDAIA